MSLSSVIKQTEEVLEDILQTIRKEYESPYPVLSETDRNRFVEEEGSLREQLEEIRETESNCSSWRRLLLLQPSPQPKCLKDAQELRQRVKNDINMKVRTRLSGRSSLSPSPSFGPSPASAIITSPLNMRCSLSEVQLSDLHVNPAVRNDRGYASDINEAINAPLGAASESGDGARNSPSRPHRWTPPPAPNYSRASSEASSDLGSDSSPRSPPVRRPAPPPPQSPGRSRFPRSPMNIPFSTSGALPNHISNLAQDMTTLASSMACQGRQRQKGTNYVTKTNCVDISGSTVGEGMTINNGGSKNSGAVIHKMIAPPRSQLVPTF
ncbi:hypothetical protein V8E55_005086 [Tylopilus felleus]